jgi:hypothetical protein
VQLVVQFKDNPIINAKFVNAFDDEFERHKCLAELNLGDHEVE